MKMEGKPVISPWRWIISMSWNLRTMWSPPRSGFSELSDGGSGNYAFLWDDQDQCISHARDFFICGYDPETGEEVPGWVSQNTYNEYKNSGLSLKDFVSRLPSFRDFTQEKGGSKEQLGSGRISLDCRVFGYGPPVRGMAQGNGRRGGPVRF